MSTISHIDSALKKYYDSFKDLNSINSYLNDDNVGKFASYCSENGFDDDNIEDEIEGGHKDCSLIDFDLDDSDHHLFPFNKPIVEKQKQDKEIYRIIKNMYIDAKTPPFQPSKSNYLFSGEQLIYAHDELQSDETDISLLLVGYIRNMESQFALHDYVGGIPLVLVQIILYFYGKQYFIEGTPPKEDEYDYAMEILAPINRIGFVHKKSRIVSLQSKRSLNNIIYGSRIIQINDTNISTDTSTKDIDKALTLAKKITPSYVIFRCTKNDTQKGTHLQYNVVYGPNKDGDKFPYYKFTKNVIQAIFNQVFGEFGTVEIMDIYASKQMSYGTCGSYGVSILIFIENSRKLFRSYEVYEAANVIQDLIRNRINDALIVRFYTKMEGIKANGIHCKWPKYHAHCMITRKPLHKLCVLVHGDRFYGDSYYLVMIDIERIDRFQIEPDRTMYTVGDQGHILFASFLIPPLESTRNKVLSDYKFYSTLD